jgi:hypothetical protein
MADVNVASLKLVALKQGDETLIHGHSVTFDQDWYRVKTDFGLYSFFYPDDAARYCLCVIPTGMTAKELGDKYNKIKKRVEELEKPVPETRIEADDTE